MAQPAQKKAASPGVTRRKKSDPQVSKGRKSAVSGGNKRTRNVIPTPEVARIGEIRIAAGPGFSAATRLKVAGLNTAFEKEKLSITLDKPVVEEIRELFGERPLSASINDLLQSALVQYRLGLLVDQLEQEVGPAPAEAYERVFSQWFEEA
jgi:hypothetical protein